METSDCTSVYPKATTAGDGGPAFPIPASNPFEGARDGMFIRDVFADAIVRSPALFTMIHAMTSAEPGKVTPAKLAQGIYAIADAMLAERAKVRA